MTDTNGAETTAMARWQGQMEAKLDAEITLRDVLRKADAEAISEARDTAQAAVDKAETQVTRRLEGFPQLYASRQGLEGLQQSLADMQTAYVDVKVYNERMKTSDDRITRTEALLLKCIGGLFVVGLIGVTNLLRVLVG